MVQESLDERDFDMFVEFSSGVESVESAASFFSCEWSNFLENLVSP